jgi:hypothetical protein
MKKLITLAILLTSFLSNSQCPTPSNLTYNYINPNEVQLNWTENGTATTWDITVIPDFNVGTPLPSNGWISGATNPFVVTGLTAVNGCYVFFVRSSCSLTNVSPWIGVGTLGCPTDVDNYIATLSNNDFSFNNVNNIKVFPNPSSNFFKIVSDTKVEKITLFDTLGKEILIQTQNNSEVNIEKLSEGIYLIEIISENKKVYKKFIKK